MPSKLSALLRNWTPLFRLFSVGKYITVFMTDFLVQYLGDFIELRWGMYT